MALHGWLEWLQGLQLLVAGLAIMLAIEQVAVLHADRRPEAPRRIALTSLCAAAVLILNAVLMRTAGASALNALVLARAIAIAALVISAVPLAGVLADPDRLRWWARTLVAVTLARVVLVLATRLVYAHRTAAGLPQYGWLLTPATLVVIVVFLLYFLRVMLLARSRAERWLVGAGAALTGGVALASLLTTATGSELLTGFVPAPALAALVGIAWSRETHGQRAVAALNQQQALLLDRLRNAQDLAHLATFELDLRRQMVRCSAEMAVMYGAGTEEFEIPLEEFRVRFHMPEERAAMAAQAEAAYAAGEPFLAEHRVVRGDGEIIWVRMRSAAAQAGHVRGALQEITQQKL